MKRSVVVCVLPISLFFCTRPSYAQMTVSWKGELVLPMSLYTGDGIELEKGKFEVEVRAEKEHEFLAFIRNGEILSLVKGQRIAAEERASNLPDLPLIGTVFLHPPQPSHVQEKEEKPTVTFAEHLKSRPWKAALRAYRYDDPQSKEVDFVLEEESKPGEWSRTDFKLFLAKPN